MTDEELLAASLDRLKAHGSIEYRGEFGAEIVTFIPFIAWLKQEGHLKGRRVTSYRGMRALYYFLDDNEFTERDAPREWVPNAKRCWPSPSTYSARASRWHVFPDYRSRFAGSVAQPNLPTVFVQNKFAVEWGVGPVNFMPLDALERLCTLAAGRFHIVYSRPGIAQTGADYSHDHNSFCDYPDRAVIARFPGAEILEDRAAASAIGYNALKLGILADARLMIAVQGGGSHLLAAFGQSLLLMLHRFGEEDPHAYTHGAYRYLSSPPPTLLVARSYPQFWQGVQMFEHVTVDGDRVRIGGAGRATFDALKL